MTKRILNGIIIVSLMVLLACTGLIMGVMYDYLGSQIDKELENEAWVVSVGLKDEGLAYLETLEKTGKVKNRFSLVAENGQVLYDSMNDEEVMENHLYREEIQEALIEGEGHAVRESETMASETRYYALLLEDGSILRIATNHYSQLGLILDTLGMVIVIVAILFGLSVAISHNITKHIVKPINDINLDRPDISENYEELAPLLDRIHQQNRKIRNQINKLRSRQEEFNLITSNMSEGLLIIDHEMEILTYNQSAIRILGGEGKTLISEEGESRGNIFALNRSEPFRAVVEEALRGEHTTHRMTIGGETYEILGSPAVSEGAVTGAILILMDITEKEVGERLRREFTSNVSHELKTPLTSIYGVSDMLAAGLVKPEDVVGFAQTIKEESARLISLIDDIMQISRLDENSVHKEKEPLDLYELAGAVLNRLEGNAEKAGVEMKLEGESTLVLGVDYILDEIIYNLCENSVKYNRPGGTVVVHVRKEAGRCILQVSDTGIGIPAEGLERVFERFYRVDKSHSNLIPGTGLGLSIVKHGVAYHGGEVHIESKENVGTMVTVQLPGDL